MAKASRNKKSTPAEQPEEKNKGGAPIGNTNAEVWDEATTMAKLAAIIKESEKPDVYYIGQALANVDLYHEWYSYVAEKFKSNDVVFNTIKKIDQLFEAKLVGKTLGGELNPTMAIFTLKNKHNWKDKSEQENKNHNYNHNAEMTKEEMKRISDNLENEV